MVGELMAVRPESINGRLVLLHGPPGTGKTTALRALARERRGWCQVDCVMDPERLFNDPSYLMDVAVGDDGEAGQRWRLLVLEDCDELNRGRGAWVGPPPAPSVRRGRAHPPSVLRPRSARCRTPKPLPGLGDSAGVGRDGATLAELYALRDGSPRLTRSQDFAQSGGYL